MSPIRSPQRPNLTEFHNRSRNASSTSSSKTKSPKAHIFPKLTDKKIKVYSKVRKGRDMVIDRQEGAKSTRIENQSKKAKSGQSNSPSPSKQSWDPNTCKMKSLSSYGDKKFSNSISPKKTPILAKKQDEKASSGKKKASSRSTIKSPKKF